jgi:hypothetical protein
MSDDTKQPESVWAVVELMGHVKLAGRLTEEEKFGAKLGRLDIPQDDPLIAGETVFVTQYFGGGSVYRITLVTEEVARHVGKKSSPAPVHSWDFPKQLAASGIGFAPGDPDDGDEH